MTTSVNQKISGIPSFKSQSLLSNFGVTTTRKAFSEMLASVISGTAALGRTYQSVLALDGDFDAIQIVFGNEHTAGYNLTASIFAVDNDTVDDSSHFPTTGLTSVTKGGSGTIAVAAGAADIPVLTETDWIPITSIPRTDGGELPLLSVRVYIDSNGGAGVTTTNHNGGAEIATFNAATDRKWFNYRSFNQDGVTTPSGFTAASTDDPGVVQPVFAVRARLRGGGITVMAVGDSTVSGITNTTTGRWNNWIFEACQSASTTSVPVMPVNLGISGQTGINYLTNGENAIDSYAPDIAVYMSTSVNDGAFDAAEITATIGRTLEFVEYCRTRGIIPIVTTRWPTAAGVALAEDFNNYIRGMNNVHVLDIDAAVGTGAANARTWLAGTVNGDNVHVNHVGELLVANRLATIINEIKSNNGL